MRKEHYAILLALLSGAAAYTWYRVGGIKIDFTISPEDVMPDSEMHVKMFDCPECSLPAEIAGMAMDIQDNGLALPCYVISCFGEHPLVAVTTEWLTENALEYR